MNNNLVDNKANKHLCAPKQRINIINRYSESNSIVAREYLNRDSLFLNKLPDESNAWSASSISNLDLFAKGIVSFMIAKNNETRDISKQYGVALNEIKSIVPNPIDHKDMMHNIDMLNESFNNFDTVINNLHSKISLIEETYQNYINKENTHIDKMHNALSRIILDKYAHSRNSILKTIIRKFRHPLLNEVNFLRNNNAVDKVYYYSHYPDAIKSGLTVEDNYVSIGVQQGRNPSANFNTLEYILQNPVIANTGMNPLVHSLLNINNNK